MVQGRLFQDAWNLLFFSIIGVYVAATLNWRNSVWGYWINFVTVGLAHTGFIFFVLVPGYTPVWPSILGLPSSSLYRSQLQAGGNKASNL
jgi:hypothetical protein